MARVQVSFKNNDKELKLYDEVMRANEQKGVEIWLEFKLVLKIMIKN